ncbi:hypothetical protein LTS08_001420 [Lithohypha guttulata]|nr:hypothetical protein LTS08_001420 [Lithohypha guttulata]
MNTDVQQDCLKSLSTTLALIDQFQKSLDSNKSSERTATASGDHPPSLSLLRAAAESLKSTTTKLSLLCITPPFTESAVKPLLKELNNSTLPSLVTATLLVTPAKFPDSFAAETRRVASSTLSELTPLLALIQQRAQDGKPKSEPSKSEKQAVTEATGRIWEKCDEAIKFVSDGIPGFVIKKAEQWLALMKDAVQELQDWDPEEDVDEDVFGLAGSDDEEDSSTFTGKGKDKDQATIAAGVKDQVSKVLSRVPQSIHVVVKQRLAKMPANVRRGDKELSSKDKQTLNSITKNVRNISECIDESVEAMYMGNPELCLKKAGEARALTIEVVVSVVPPWESPTPGTEPTKEDMFIKRALAWIEQQTLTETIIEKMEDRLSAPLPLLALDSDTVSLRSVSSSTGPFTTPGEATDDTELVIHWQAAELLNRINIDALLHKVPKLAGSDCEIERVPVIKSYMNVLLLLQEKDTDKQCITRIPYCQSDRDFLIDQVEPLIRVNRKFSFRVPYLYHYGLAQDPENELRVDFMLLDFIDGRQMKMWTESFPAWEQKRQVLEQIAEIYLEMFSKPVIYKDRLVLNNANNIDGMQEDFDNFDIPPTMTASSYLHRLADKAIRGKVERLLASNATERTQELRTTMQSRLMDLLILLLMRALIPTQIVGKYNDSYFYITHPDLHNRNIVIEGNQAGEEVIPDIRARGFSTSESPKPQIHLPHRRTVSFETTERAKKDKLKVAGIVDWDAAHPLPLQAAAIYPKFLETLPGAEFPDLPDNYVAPDMTMEKETFVAMLKRKEQKKTGCTTVADLIVNGSWERDFFTVALRRGDVRAKWFPWWKMQAAKQNPKNSFVQEEPRLEDIDNIRTGLQGFLANAQNSSTVQQHSGWLLIWRIVSELDRLEALAQETCWMPAAKKWAAVKTTGLKNLVTSPVADMISQWERGMPGSLEAPPLQLKTTSEHDTVDSYTNFVLGADE